MKKLIAMIGAVAMSFGLFAASPAPFTISFEQAEQDKGVNTTSMLFTPVESDTEWAWTTDEALPLKAYAGDAFTYGEGAYARRDGKFDAEGDNNYYLPLSTGNDELTRAVNGNLYLDQLVKFTGFEDPQTNLVAGTKIAVWMSEFENDDESTETNLYVTVGKVDIAGNAKQIALKVDGTYSLDTWYRLSIKSLNNIMTDGSTRAGFLVYVNGQQVGSSDADAKLLIAADDAMDGIAKGYMTKGQLFTAIDATDATFNTVGYQGIGAVDDIILDSVGPAFCQAIDVVIPEVDGAVVDYIDVGGTRMQPPVAVPDGTTITVYFKAAEGKKITGSVTFVTKTITTGDATINVEGIVAEDVVATLTPFEGTASDLAASELAGALADLGVGDKIATIAACGITEGEGEGQTTLYAFTPNTTITGTATGWSIYVGNYEEGEDSGAGVLEFYTGVAADSTLTVELENPVDGMFMFAGNVAGTLTAEYLVDNGGITLSGEGKVITTDGTLGILDSDSNQVTPTADVPEAGWYTYALSDVPPEKIEYVTFTVTYDTAKVENVTVKTNGANVVDVEGVYTVESNAVVTVAATAKEGYQNVTITGDNVTVDAGVFKADKASSVITIAAEEIPPAPGFKIRLAGIDAADVEEGTDSITIKTEAQPLVYINGAAATVAGEAGAWTVTKPAISADTAISIVKGANIPAVGHKWYENATIVGSTAVVRTEGVTDGCAGWNGALDLAGNYIAAAYGYASQNLILTTVSDLVNAGDTAVDPITVVDASTNGGSLRGAAVSAALGVMITGNANSGAIRVYSLDGLTTNLVTTSNGVVPDAFAFDADGQTLWANGYSPSSARNAIYKYTIKDNLIGDGEKLELAATYEVGERVRGMKKFGDVIIAKTESHWYVMNLADDTPTFAQMTFDDYNYFDDVEIAGEHFYHLDAADGPGGVIKVYNLNAAGTWFEGDPIKTISITGDIGCSRCSNSGISFFVTADEETMIFTDRRDDQCENIVRAIQWTLPTYDITFATVENGTLETSVTNGIAAGTTVTVIVIPATGYECTEITTNGTAITGTSFEMPAGDVEIGATFTLQQFTVAAITVDNASVVATNTVTDTGLNLPATVDYNTEIAVTVTPNENYEYKNAPAGWTKNGDGSITTNATVTADLTITVEAPTAALQPVEPGELIKGKTPEEVNANLDKYLKVPEIEGIVAATYRAMFAAKQSGDDVVIDLNPDVEKDIQDELDAATATVLAPDETGMATITARIGLYYGIKAAGEVGSVDTEAVQNGVQATTTKLKITVPTADSKATPFTDKAFFKTICSPKAFK